MTPDGAVRLRWLLLFRQNRIKTLRATERILFPDAESFILCVVLTPARRPIPARPGL